MNKRSNFGMIDDEADIQSFEWYQELSKMRVYNDRSMYHKLLYQAQGEMKTRGLEQHARRVEL